MTRSSWLTGAVLAGLFFALHLPFLPPSLEDLDSINFALGVRDYDVSRHQPHPPGYPLFILAAKTLHKAGVSEVRALSLLSVLGGALGVFGCFGLFLALDGDAPLVRLKPDPTSDRYGDSGPAPQMHVASGGSRTGTWPWLAVILVITCPLYWVTAARPLSDAAGLGIALLLQALIVSATSSATLTLAAACSGFALGLRSQIVWLTLPLLALALVRRPAGDRWRGALRAALAYLAGALVWAIPLLIVSGPVTYLRTFWRQGVEDVGGVAMLATTHTVSLLARTLRDQLIAPWGYWQTGTVVIVLAMLGFVSSVWRARHALATLIVAFGPYLVFDLLFQEAITTRYALPLIIPIAYFAIHGASLLNKNLAVVAALAIASAAVFVDDATAYGFAEMPAPAFRMLGDMHANAPTVESQQPVLAMHRNEDFSMRRPIQWVGAEMPTIAAHLPAPPKHEWLEAVHYWNHGGRHPVWFVADPLRSDLALIHKQRRPSLYRWPFAFTMLLGGARPSELDWHVIEMPDWYLDEGWSLTPETAGVAAEEHRGPGFAPIHGWIRRWPQPLTLMIGGRNLAASGPAAHVRVTLDGAAVSDIVVAPGFFLQMAAMPAAVGAGDYVELTVESDSQQVAIEQFDAQPAGRVVSGFGDGWNEQEYNPTTGALWRWSTDRSAIRVRSEGHAVALTLRGEIEAASSSHVVVRAGNAVASAFDVGRSFSRTVLIPSASLPGPEDVITIETSAWSVPAEKQWRSRDRRRLGLKLFECAVTPAS